MGILKEVKKNKELMESIIKNYHFIIDHIFDEVIDSDILYEEKFRDVKQEETISLQPILVEKTGEEIHRLSSIWFLEIIYKIAMEVSKIPMNKKWILIWRCLPEVNSSVNFETLKPTYSVYGRCYVYWENEVRA